MTTGRKDWREVPREDWQFNVFRTVSGTFEFDPEVPETKRAELVQRMNDTDRAFVLAQAAYRDALLDPLGDAEAAFDGWWNTMEDKRLLLEEIEACTVGQSWTEVPDLDSRMRALGLPVPERPDPAQGA